MKKILFLFLLLQMFACRQQKPKGILDQQTYKKVLKEIIFANLINQDIRKKKDLDQDLIETVYQKYHIDSLKFKRTTDYYSEQPELMIKIYTQIYDEIKHVSDSLEKLEPKKKTKTDKIITKEKHLKKKIPELPKNLKIKQKVK